MSQYKHKSGGAKRKQNVEADERKNKLPKIDKFFNKKTDQTDEPSISRTATTSYSTDDYLFKMAQKLHTYKNDITEAISAVRVRITTGTRARSYVVTECQAIWRSLKDKYCREHKALERRLASGASADETSLWEWYNELNFLNSHSQKRTSISNIKKRKRDPHSLLCDEDGVHSDVYECGTEDIPGDLQSFDCNYLKHNQWF
ncbi:hypothetical protein FQA39_LY06932 [Lamprigera yunnana]|nr:hypothetical protein FQA39_LY06932 [Lamprigera yunnana]